MIWQRVRIALLASVVAMAAALPIARPAKALAGDCGNCGPAVISGQGAGTGSTSAAPGTAGPAYRTVTVTEMVPEYYNTTRTVNRTQQVQEKYTAYRIERVPETRTRTVTVYDKVPVEEIRHRTITESVPTIETRTCMEKHKVCKQVTTYKRKCVDNGHWECRTVECGPSLWDRVCSKRNKGCCDDPCNTCCKPVRTKTVKCWVPCKTWVETPCTKTVKCTEYRPVCKQVKVCKKVCRTESYKCTVIKCVPRQKTETYTCCVEKKIPYEATRTVCKCVPVQEQVRCCRMVKRCVEKQVPVCDTCDTPCCVKTKKHFSLFKKKCCD
jgi:hypothetical protein